MAREPAHVGQPQRPGCMPIRRQGRPFHRELRRDGLGLALLHERDEVAEPPGLVLVLLSEPLAHAQILLECGAQIGHRAPPAMAGSMSAAPGCRPSRISDDDGSRPGQLTVSIKVGAGTEKLGGEAVPEDMGAAVCAALDADAIKSGLGDHRDRAPRSKADMRRERADREQPPTDYGRPVRRYPNDGRANVRRDRHPCALPALGTNERLADTPVDLIEGEGRDLVGPPAKLAGTSEWRSPAVP